MVCPTAMVIATGARNSQRSVSCKNDVAFRLSQGNGRGVPLGSVSSRSADAASMVMGSCDRHSGAIQFHLYPTMLTSTIFPPVLAAGPDISWKVTGEKYFT